MIRWLPERDSEAVFGVFGVAVLLAFLVTGCARDRAELELGMAGPAMAPRPPLFLTGPMAFLLTNAGGFSATATLEYGDSSNRLELASGKLLGLGSMLLFAPESGEDLTRQAKEAGISFLWNATNNSGHVLSDALQAYAPMTLSYRVTNLVTRTEGSVTERLDGHKCAKAEFEAQASDGTRASLLAWQAADLRELPLRILLQSSGRPIQLRLSKARLENLSPELFQLPESFRQYPSAESIMGELAMRKQHLKFAR